MGSRSLIWIPFVAAACSGPSPFTDAGPAEPSPNGCLASTPITSLYTGECQPPQDATFCFFPEDTNF